jgi:hypothetical protein
MGNDYIGPGWGCRPGVTAQDLQIKLEMARLSDVSLSGPKYNNMEFVDSPLYSKVIADHVLTFVRRGLSEKQISNHLPEMPRRLVGTYMRHIRREAAKREQEIE